MREEVGRVDMGDGEVLKVGIEMNKGISVEDGEITVSVVGKVFVECGDEERVIEEKMFARDINIKELKHVSLSEFDKIADEIELDLKAIATNLYVMLKLAKEWGWDISF